MSSRTATHIARVLKQPTANSFRNKIDTMRIDEIRPKQAGALRPGRMRRKTYQELPNRSLGRSEIHGHRSRPSIGHLLYQLSTVRLFGSPKKGTVRPSLVGGVTFWDVSPPNHGGLCIKNFGAPFAQLPAAANDSPNSPSHSVKMRSASRNSIPPSGNRLGAKHSDPRAQRVGRRRGRLVVMIDSPAALPTAIF